MAGHYVNSAQRFLRDCAAIDVQTGSSPFPRSRGPKRSVKKLRSDIDTWPKVMQASGINPQYL
jgi:hypothetical protein